MVNYIKKFSRFSNKKTTTIIIVAIFILIPIYAKLKLPTQVQAHSNDAYPTEIFSIWNDTNPSIDGTVQFSTNQKSAEWSSASVNWMYNRSKPEGKLLLQNTDYHLYVGMDMINYQSDTLLSPWGAAVYLDRDHNGILSTDDRSIIFWANITGRYVFYNQYAVGIQEWVRLDWEFAGNIFANLIVANTTYTTSVFETNPHHQFEFRIPMSVLNSGPGKIIGIGFESYENYYNPEGTITWPALPDQPPSDIWMTEGAWGDLYLGKNETEADYYAQYVIEENINIEDDATGPYNSTFMCSGDINGNGDLELIVSSNRTVIGEDEYLAIYDYVGNDLTRIWFSPDSGHQIKMFVITGIATNDFDENGEDEIYLCGKDSRILRLFNWNETEGDFDNSEFIYVHSRALLGYIAIGDADNDGLDEIVVASTNTAVDTSEIIILGYDNATGKFNPKYTEFDPPLIGGSTPEKVLGIEIANMDADSNNELLIWSQTTDNETLGTTRLQILEKGMVGFTDNSGDDLPSGSNVNTEDCFGHTIIVADVDNDSTNETIIVGRDYLRIFGAQTFSSPATISLLINDGISLPAMGGGAIVGDIDGDSANELIVGCNNGTILILNVTDSGSDNFSYTEEWSNDLGTSPGYHEAMVIYDLDEDTENELFFGDYFGQIISLGKSQAPTVTISSPSWGSIKTSTTVEVFWDVVEDLSMHHFDIRVNGVFQVRAGANQTSMFVNLLEGENYVWVNGWDVTGKNNSDLVRIDVSLDAPEITITSPENFYKTEFQALHLEFLHDDLNRDFDYYEIFLEGNSQGTTSNNFTDITLPGIDGTYNITVVGIDDNLNTGRDTIFVTYDNTNPEIVITAPIEGTAVRSSTVNLQWTASDALSGIDYFIVSIDGIPYTTTTALSQIVPLNGDKDYNLAVRAFDEAGNYFDDDIFITKDTVNPFVNITSPNNGLFTESTSITLYWEQNDNIGGTDIEYSEVTVNGLLAYSGADTSQLIDLVDDGIKDIIVTTYDYAGNTAYDHILVIVDTTNPFIEILSPIDNYNTSLDELTIYWRASDNETGIDEYQIYVDSGLYQTITIAGITSTTITFTQNKTYLITVKAIDYLGHEFQDTISVNYDSSAPALAITSPVKPYYYSAVTNVTLEWDFANIENMTQIEIFVDENLNATILILTTKSYELVFGTIPIDQFPMFNVTVVIRTTNSSVFYVDQVWISIDQAAPTVSIDVPLNNTIIEDHVIYLEWLSADSGSGILKTIVKVDGLIVDVWDYIKNNQYLNLENMYGLTPVTIDIIDLAGNYGSDTIYLDLFLMLPQFTVDLPTPYYSQTEDFNFDLNVNNPRAGVMGINVYIDAEKVVTLNYESNIRDTPFTLQINVTSLLYNPLFSHSLEIVIIDSFSRETSYTNTFYIDDEAPQIISPTLGTQALGGSSVEIEINKANGETKFNLNVTITDSHQINTISVRIIGPDYDEVFPMIPEAGNTDTLGQYYVTLDFSNLTLGDYSITITVTDTAGNIESQIYDITLTSFSPVPWILQGNNLIYVSAGSGLVVLLTIILSVSLRRTFSNLGWKKDIVAVAYIFNGMPCVYMVNSPDLVQDELLFGGAMTGIRGILEEITGEKSKLEIQTVEMGQKNVLICPGNYGDAVLIINKIRPIYRDKVIRFTKNFEKNYEHILKSDEIFVMERFTGAQILVQEHFGVHDEMQLIDDCSYDDIKLTPEEREYYDQQTRLEQEQQIDQQQVQPYEPQTQADPMAEAADAFAYEEPTQAEPEPQPQPEPVTEADEKVAAETMFIEEVLQKVTPEQRALFIDLIQNAQSALTELLERNFDEANEINAKIVVNLEKLLASESITNDANNLLKTLLILSTEFHAAIDHSQKGEEAALQRVVEKASRIWLTDIGDKW